MNKFQKILAAILIVFIVTTIFLQIRKNQSNALGITPEKEVQINDVKIQVEVMETVSEVQKGLSDKTHLSDNAGMLFEIGVSKKTTFWMKEMKFSIDIIWINKGTIVGIEKNAPTPTENIPTFPSPSEVDQVLEVNAGFTRAHNIKTGDKVEVIE